MLTFPHQCTERVLFLVRALAVFHSVVVPGFLERDPYCFETFMTVDNAPVYAVWKYCVHTNVSTESILKNQSPVSKSKCTCNSCKSCPVLLSAMVECPLSAGGLETIQGISSTVIENLLLFVFFFSWVTSDNLYFSMNVCILSKRLPMFAYGCSHYPFKSFLYLHTWECPLHSRYRLLMASLYSLSIQLARASQPWRVGSDDSLLWGLSRAQ